MKLHKAYTIKIDGKTYICCDDMPTGCEIIKEDIYYTPDEGYVFVKDGEFYSSVFIREGVKIEDYTEIKDPRPQPEVIEQGESDA